MAPVLYICPHLVTSNFYKYCTLLYWSFELKKINAGTLIEPIFAHVITESFVLMASHEHSHDMWMNNLQCADLWTYGPKFSHFLFLFGDTVTWACMEWSPKYNDPTMKKIPLVCFEVWREQNLHRNMKWCMDGQPKI